MLGLELSLITQNAAMVLALTKSAQPKLKTKQTQISSVHQKTPYKLFKILANSLMADHNSGIITQLLCDGQTKRQKLPAHIHLILGAHL